MATEIVYETHSITTDNETGVVSGWLQSQLSEQGKRNAAELGERRRGTGLDAVLVSDFDRALDTARIAFAGTDIPIIPDARLRECNYGDLNGCTAAELD